MQNIRLEKLKELDYFGKLLNENMSEVIRELIEEGKKLKAIELYKQRKVSLGLASKLSGLSLSEFLDLLEEYNVKLNLTLENAKRRWGMRKGFLWVSFKDERTPKYIHQNKPEDI